MRNSRHAARAANFALSLDNFLNSFSAELTGDLIDLLTFSRWRLRSAIGNLSLHFTFDLRLDGAVLLGPACFVQG